VTGEPGLTLESLDFEWGDVYVICYARDRWAALRRGTHRFLTAAALHELATKIETDYAAHPVPHEVSAPGTADYPDTPDNEDQVPGRDGDKLELLMGLRATFPHWNISYSPSFRAWTARNDDATICQKTPALLCAALLLAERTLRQPRHGTAGTGPPDPVANPLMPHPVTITCTRCGQAFTCDASSDAARDRTGPAAPAPPAPSNNRTGNRSPSTAGRRIAARRPHRHQVYVP
jgi:hypothetical protein